MPHESLLEDVVRWTRLGWMRPIEGAFVQLLSELEPDAGEPVLLIAALASHQFGQGHIGLSLEDALSDPIDVLRLPPEPEPDADPEQLRVHEAAAAAFRKRLDALSVDAARQAMSESSLFDAGDGTSPLVQQGRLVYLRRSWQAEGEIARMVAGMSGVAASTFEPEQLRQWIDGLFAPSNQEAPALPQPGSEDNDLARNGWQKVACALAARNRLTVISGGPGTGKTWTVVKILALLQVIHLQHGNEPLRIRLAAPTGKAAQRLDESIRSNWQDLPQQFQGVDLIRPERASTLHRLLGSRLHTRFFRHGRANRLNADVVIVDEASMIDQELMQALLEALRPETRLILLGDKDQLASVEAGAVFGDLCEGVDAGDYGPEIVEWLQRASGYDLSGWQGTGGLADQRVMLRWNHRSREQIDRVSRLINAREAEAALEFVQSAENEDLGWIEPEDDNDPDLRRLVLRGVSEQVRGFEYYLEVIKAGRAQLGARPAQANVDRWANECLAAQARFQLLCAVRKGPWGVEAINRHVQAWLAARGRVAPGGEWFDGRPVMITRNDYRTGLMNGDLGLCLEVPGEDGEVRTRVVFPRDDGRLHYFSPGRIRHCETAWAMTVHKSQGSEFGHVGLILPDRDNPILTTELVYTGITRAKDHATVIAPSSEVFLKAVGRRIDRASALSERLAE
ncbi:MAG: exodeoxyribonuclease V subunit alpha [Xanthomonadales bacterium]|nr:exodeoxyribonuclease V subunit alpha [Xanthomonadales bacterium]